MLSSLESLNANFIRYQANLSRDQARRQRDRLIKEQRLDMPLRFASKNDYLAKLTELLFLESQCERINTEMYAEKDVQFQFDERHHVFSSLRMQVTRSLQ